MDKTQNEKSKKKSFRNVGLQTIVQSKDYISPSVAIQHNLESEEYPKVFAIPHNVTALVVICSIIFALSQREKYNIPGLFEENAKMGIIACIICICVFGSLFLPDSLMRRPHPIFWRLIMSFSILYLLFITFILFQSRDDARAFLAFFDKKLGVELPEKNYGEKCEVLTNNYPYINFENITDALDSYLTAHLLGWYIKMLIIRDVKLCWFLSIFFEILEITFRHWLPNFWECWWDHLLLDILGCNALGIWLGDLTCKYFEMKTYGWIKSTDNLNENNTNYINNPSVKNETKKDTVENKNKYNLRNSFKFISYFTPNHWVKHDWKIFSSFKRFYNVFWFILFLNIVDLSHFFMKFILWIPNTHFLLFIRINIWAYLAMVSAREYYEYISNKSCKRLGPFIWISHLIMFIECSITYKFSTGIFTEPFPKFVIYFWIGVIIVLSAIAINLITKDFIKMLRKEIVDDEKINLLEPGIEIEYIQ